MYQNKINLNCNEYGLKLYCNSWGGYDISDSFKQLLTNIEV